MTIKGGYHALALGSIWFNLEHSRPLSSLLVVIREEITCAHNSGKQAVFLVEKLPHLADAFKGIWVQSLLNG